MKNKKIMKKLEVLFDEWDGEEDSLVIGFVPRDSKIMKSLIVGDSQDIADLIFGINEHYEEMKEEEC